VKRALVRRAAARRRVAHLDLHSKPVPHEQAAPSTSTPKGDQ
jgi:hypothetical protein